ncbi:MAG: DoxX family protein [Vicinamibacterales bacterium]
MRDGSRHEPPGKGRRLATLALAIIFIVAGSFHLFAPAPYRAIMPAWLPAHDALILISGIAEILGGAGLLLRRTRHLAAIGLILLLIAVFPANIEMLREYRAQGLTWWGEAALWLRLPLQALLIWWAWKVR